MGDADPARPEQGDAEMSYRYAIQCQRMQRLEEFVVPTAYELLHVLANYIERHGPIDLLYCVGRA